MDFRNRSAIDFYYRTRTFRWAPELSRGDEVLDLRRKTVDNKAALNVLETEAALAKERPVSGEWVQRAEHLSSLCRDNFRTHIAMLGTSLLAKATDPSVDVFTIKVGKGEAGAYSARSLAKEVLAAHAPRLGIDLGVTGREPLNNMPYFRLARLDAEGLSIVRPNARPAYQYVLECLTELEKLDANDARLALRAFLQVRERKSVAYAVESGRGAVLESALVAAIEAFVGDDAEGGRRAQAVGAGILDVMYSEGVLFSRVNDPDRRFPGDVAVSDGETIERAFEIRDKPVTETDLYHFVQKLQERGVVRGALVAVAYNQDDIETGEVERWAAAQSVKFKFFRGWASLVSEAMFWASGDPNAMLEGVEGTILDRLEEIEVSAAGIELWLRQVDDAERMH